jgi:hypothetical protein
MLKIACGLVLVVAIGIRVWAIDPSAFKNPYAWITNPNDTFTMPQGVVSRTVQNTFHPGDVIALAGHAKASQGDGTVLPSGDLTWTVSTVENEGQFLFKTQGNSSTWTVPSQTSPFKQYWIKLWAEDRTQNRNVVQQYLTNVVPKNMPGCTTMTIVTMRDGNIKHADPDMREDGKDRVLVKYTFYSSNSRVGYWDFYIPNIVPVYSAFFSLYCPGEMSANGSFALKWKSGFINEHGNLTWNSRPPDSLFLPIGEYNFNRNSIFNGTERFTEWFNFDITQFFNSHRNQRITLRLEMLNSMGIGPEFASRETNWLPQEDYANGGLAHAGRLIVAIPQDVTGAYKRDSNKQIELKAWPNPFKEHLTLVYTIKKERQPGPVSLRIFDLKGKIVQEMIKEARYSAGKIILNTSSLTSGLYYARIITQNQSLTRKLTLIR